MGKFRCEVKKNISMPLWSFQHALMAILHFGELVANLYDLICSFHMICLTLQSWLRIYVFMNIGVGLGVYLQACFFFFF